MPSVSEIRNLASMQGLAAYLLERNPLQGFVRDLRRLQVSFGGRDGSYWASDGQSSMSNELPDKLEQDLRNLQLPGGAWLTKPRLVALGVDDNYVLLTTSGPFSSQLRAYPKVFAALDGMSSVPGGVDQIQASCPLLLLSLGAEDARREDKLTLASSVTTEHQSLLLLSRLSCRNHPRYHPSIPTEGRSDEGH